MTEGEAKQMAKRLIESYGDRPFEISMPDKASYDQMRLVLANLGRLTGPDGDYFVIKVFPVDAEFIHA